MGVTVVSDGIGSICVGYDGAARYLGLGVVAGGRVSVAVSRRVVVVASRGVGVVASRRVRVDVIVDLIGEASGGNIIGVRLIAGVIHEIRVIVQSSEPGLMSCKASLSRFIISETTIVSVRANSVVCITVDSRTP